MSCIPRSEVRRRAILALPIVPMFLCVPGCVGDNLGDTTAVPVALIDTRFEKMDPATAGRTPIDRTEVKRASANVIGASGKIYVIGGFGEDLKLMDTVEAFDPVAGTWSTLAPWSNSRFLAGFVSTPDRICASPGATDLELVAINSTWDCYDIATDMWRILARPPGKKDVVALGTHAGELYMLGGFDLLTRTPSKLAYRYDMSASSWVELAPMPAPCDTLHVVTVGDTLFTLGCNTDSPTTEFYAYDVMADSWTTPPPPPDTVGHHYPTEPFAYGNGFVFFTILDGGVVWSYDAVTEQWSKSGPMPAAAGAFTSALVGDKLFVRLFTEDPAKVMVTPSGKHFVYDLVAGTWALLNEGLAEPELFMHGIAESGSIYYAGDATEIVLKTVP